jgi:hypothetical protein
MASIFFGNYAGQLNNGNWRDISQWWLNPGSSGEHYNAPTPLNRFPDPAYDIVNLAQNPTSNVGTYVGIYPNGYWQTGTTYSGEIIGGYLLDPNAIWTGKLRSVTCFKGTFSGTFDSFPGQYISLHGGTVTSSAVFANTLYALRIGDANIDLPSDANPYFPLSLTLPNNLSLSSNTILQIDRGGFDWKYDTKFKSISIYEGANTSNRLPIISTDISTSKTGCIEFYIALRNRYSQSTSLVNANTVFTNTSPLIFGTPSTPAQISLFYFDTNREITAYVSGNTNPSEISCGSLAPVYDKLNIIQVGTEPASITVLSPITWKPKLNVPLTRTFTSTGPKFVIPSEYTPRQYGFGITGNSIFDPTINLALPTNLNAEI